MSMTSGPMLPVSNGNVTGPVPSENVSVAVRSVIVHPSSIDKTVALRYALSSCDAQLINQRAHRRLGLAATRNQVPQLVVRQCEQRVEHGNLFFGERRAFRVQEAGQDQIVFEQTAPATPSNPRELAVVQEIRVRLDFHVMSYAFFRTRRENRV